MKGEINYIVAKRRGSADYACQSTGGGGAGEKLRDVTKRLFTLAHMVCVLSSIELHTSTTKVVVVKDSARGSLSSSLLPPPPNK